MILLLAVILPYGAGFGIQKLFQSSVGSKAGTDPLRLASDDPWPHTAFQEGSIEDVAGAFDKIRSGHHSARKEARHDLAVSTAGAQDSRDQGYTDGTGNTDAGDKTDTDGKTDSDTEGKTDAESSTDAKFKPPATPIASSQGSSQGSSSSISTAAAAPQGLPQQQGEGEHFGRQLGTGPIDQPEEDEQVARQQASINPEKAEKDAKKRLEAMGDPNAESDAKVVRAASAQKQVDAVETKLLAALGERDKVAKDLGWDGSGAWSPCLLAPVLAWALLGP